MFLAKFEENFVLIKEDKYSYVDFDYETFKWDDSPNLVWINNQKITNKNTQAPIVQTTKIICVGKNFARHAKEMGGNVPKEPLLFQKPPSSVIGPNKGIEIPSMSSQVEYETELVLIIKKKGKNIHLKEAESFIFGYTIGLDITARDLQKSDKTWFRGKGFDTFAPLGPWIVPSDSLDLNNCKISLNINGKLRQEGNLKDMVFNVSDIVSYVSKIVTLNPGDLIYTGTPEGVGPLKSKDILEAFIEGIGTLTVFVH